MRAHIAPEPVPGGGGAAGEALGRSRGGLTTKIHLSADGRCRPLSLVVTPGQRADCTQFEPVMDKIRVPRLGTGPAQAPAGQRRAPTRRTATADRAAYLRTTRHPARDPGEEQTTETARHAKARTAADRRASTRTGTRASNTVERAINKLKQFRAVATRYDKRRYVYLGTVTAAALLIWLRS